MPFSPDLSHFSFLGKGSSKKTEKYFEKACLTLLLFWPLTYPPSTGVSDFFVLAAPC
jgi:hypothetical protein